MDRYHRKAFAPLLIIVLVAIVVFVGGGMYYFSRQIDQILVVGEEYRVHGTVLEHIKDCFFDGICYYRIKTSEGTINVVYAEGWKNCLSSSDFSSSIQEGSKVEVFGKATSKKTISTCEAPEYYVVPIYGEIYFFPANENYVSSIIDQILSTLKFTK